jgi:asparagine synthase (glutamine-hydrolysing)
MSPLSGMRRALDVMGAPALAPSNQFWLIDLLSTARDRGHRVLLTGQLGNVTVSWQGRPGPRQWRTHLRRRDWRAAVAGLLPEFWGARVRAGRRHGGATPWREYSAIHPEFASRLRLADRMAAEDHDPTFARTQPAFDQRVRLLHAAAGDLAEVGAAHDLDVCDPTADLRVLRFCLATPDAQFLGPHGEGRWLIRRAMSGLLPPAVLWNERRGLQSADLVLRLRADAANVDAALDACAGDQRVREYVDVTYLRDVWTHVQARHDLATHRKAVAVLCRGLMVGLFLIG